MSRNAIPKAYLGEMVLVPPTGIEHGLFMRALILENREYRQMIELIGDELIMRLEQEQ